MRAKNSAWAVFAVVCLGLGSLLGCDAHNRSVNAAKPGSEAQPLFTPVAASLAQQKMCDEQAAKKFSENGHGKSDTYTSHYDPTVNVCYIRVHSISAEKFPMVTDVVYDAFGGRVYANYMWINSQNKKYWEVSPSTCEIHIPGKPDEKCKTDAEFDVLTEKYFGVTQEAYQARREWRQWRVAPISVKFCDQDVGAPGPSHLGTGDDAESGPR